jgi:hypothetical protein
LAHSSSEPLASAAASAITAAAKTTSSSNIRPKYILKYLTAHCACRGSCELSLVVWSASSTHSHPETGQSRDGCPRLTHAMLSMLTFAGDQLSGFFGIVDPNPSPTDSLSSVPCRIHQQHLPFHPS